MKHFTTNSQAHYHHAWRAHSIRFIAALAMTILCIVGAVVAGLYGKPGLIIASFMAAVFFAFVAVIKFYDCDRAYSRMLRSIIHPEDIFDDSNPDDQ